MTDWRATLPVVVIGVGLGGLLDGILLHQVLQWHHLVSNVVPPADVEAIRFNLFVDGLFHQAMWIVSAAGVFLLYVRLVKPQGRAQPSLVGGVLLGWGGFTVFDSVVNHWLLRLHNIRPGADALAYDVAFFSFGLVLAGVGLWSLRRHAARGRTA